MRDNHVVQRVEFLPIHRVRECDGDDVISLENKVSRTPEEGVPDSPSWPNGLIIIIIIIIS
jgi:hypothetical protein